MTRWRQRMGEEKLVALIQESLWKLVATPAGLEPATCRLEGGCSIQLSYGAERD